MKPAEEGPAKILIVEDELLIAMLLEDMVAGGGYGVMGPYSRAAPALRQLEDEMPAAAILDVNIQGGTSFPIADALTAKGLPFIFLTGRDYDTLPPPYSGCPTLKKPASRHELLSALSKMLGGRKKS
jgi:DNA-binding response OmpR family regulator